MYNTNNNNNNNNDNDNNMCLEIRRIWIMKCINIPVITGVDGNVWKRSQENSQ